MTYLCNTMNQHMYKPLLLVTSLCAFLCACSLNNVTIRNDWEAIFRKYHLQGCFMLYDNGKNQFQVYNLDRTQQRFLPASTFKIMNSLVGLETGVISDTNMVIQWDGVVRPIAAWNKDMSMKEAFRVSCVPYYQEVARRIGHDRMKLWIDSVKYGNRQMGARVDTCWLDNSLQISPDEELGFVKKLYFDQLPFQKRTMRLVRDVMLFENMPQYKLYYKTGWGQTGNKQIAWIVGWEEEQQHPYFFVLNFETTDTTLNVPRVRMEILKTILKNEGFLEGKK